MMDVRPRRYARRLRPGRLLPLAGLAAAGAALVAGASPAGASGDECPSSNPPNELRLVSGSPQTAQLGKAFQGNLQIRLANTNGCPPTGQLAGVTITFVAPGDGASGTFASSATNVASVGTDDNGIATAPPFTANHSAGSYSVYAQSDYGSVRFDLTNTARGVPASISADGQPAREATTDSQYSQPLKARVRDADGKPVAGVSVAFAIAAGPTGADASFIGGAPQATALTDSDGLATSPPLVANGSPGRFAASASTDGVMTPAAFSLTNHAAATAISASSGKQLRATVKTRYRRPLKARVLDASGQPIEGVDVTFTVTAAASGAGASFADGAAQATETTDATGKAASPPLVANKTAGRFTASAAITGDTYPARYRLRNLAGKPAGISAGAASGESTRAGTRFPIPLAVTVTDADGNPVPAATVVFAAPARGPSGRFAGRPRSSNRTARVRTNSKGVAIAPEFTANDVRGGYIVTAITNGRRVAFALINDARQ